MCVHVRVCVYVSMHTLARLYADVCEQGACARVFLWLMWWGFLPACVHAWPGRGRVGRIVSA